MQWHEGIKILKHDLDSFLFIYFLFVFGKATLQIPILIQAKKKKHRSNLWFMRSTNVVLKNIER